MDLLAEIVKAINGTLNDMELGKKVREIFDAAKRENLHRNFKLGEHIEYPTSVVLTLHKSKLTEEEPERIKQAKDFFDKLEDEK